MPNFMKRKLEAYQVIEIRHSDSDVKTLADKYGVSRKTIDDVKQGITWKRLLSQQVNQEGLNNEN